MLVVRKIADHPSQAKWGSGAQQLYVDPYGALKYDAAPVDDQPNQRLNFDAKRYNSFAACPVLVNVYAVYVNGSSTNLTGCYSLEVRVIPVDGSPVFSY